MKKYTFLILVFFLLFAGFISVGESTTAIPIGHILSRVMCDLLVQDMGDLYDNIYYAIPYECVFFSVYEDYRMSELYILEPYGSEITAYQGPLFNSKSRHIIVAQNNYTFNNTRGYYRVVFSSNYEGVMPGSDTKGNLEYLISDMNIIPESFVNFTIISREKSLNESAKDIFTPEIEKIRSIIKSNERDRKQRTTLLNAIGIIFLTAIIAVLILNIHNLKAFFKPTKNKVVFFSICFLPVLIIALLFFFIPYGFSSSARDGLFLFISFILAIPVYILVCVCAYIYEKIILSKRNKEDHEVLKNQINSQN